MNNSNDIIYVLVGYEDICLNGNFEGQVYGAFSSEELAREAGDELVECSNVEYYEIECPELDECGWR